MQKNDTVTSQLQSNPVCSIGDKKINFHDWKKVSDEDLVIKN